MVWPDVIVFFKPDVDRHLGLFDAVEPLGIQEFGFAKNHPFNDANKRTALIAIRLFLKLNGYDLAASPPDKYKTIIPVDASNIIED